METYTHEQFANSLYVRGYFKTRSEAEKYVVEHPKEVYTEDDFQEVYHDENLIGDYMRNKPIKALSNGRNRFDAEYWD